MQFRLIYLAIAFSLISNTIYAQFIHIYLNNDYEKYRETSITDRRFKHVDIVPLIQRLKNDSIEVNVVGESVEGREIHLVKMGTGDTKILLWSQMHGDEPTATMAMMDIFNFFTSKDGLDNFRKNILDKVTLFFIPMLNPDGAERFDRRNALGVDLNRDALRLQSPEAQLLKQIRATTEADWGFNLHDQSRYYTVGNTENSATISFLAPAYNPEKQNNEVRSNAMKLIGKMNDLLQTYIPGQVAKYDDEFEPRAFGDNIQKWGTSTILIEAGGLNGDDEKQYTRKLHFIALLYAFDAIANKSYENETISKYLAIPENGDYLHDLLIRNATIEKSKQFYTVDVAFKRNELGYDNQRKFYHKAHISDVGDLSTYFGYQELDATGMTIVSGKTHPEVFADLAATQKRGLMGLLKKGYTHLKVTNMPQPQEYIGVPMQFIGANESMPNPIKIGNNSAFFLEKEGEKLYAVVNGKLFDLR